MPENIAKSAKGGIEMKTKKISKKLQSVYCGTAEEKEEFIRQETDDYRDMIYMPIFNRRISAYANRRIKRLNHSGVVVLS